jgi:hypothetical protein
MNRNNKIQRKRKDEQMPIQNKQESPSKTMAPPPFALSSSAAQLKQESSGSGGKLPDGV